MGYRSAPHEIVHSPSRDFSRVRHVQMSDRILVLKGGESVEQGGGDLSLPDFAANILVHFHDDAAPLDWTARVVEGCRGTNDALESYYDEVLESGRIALEAASLR